MRSIVLGLAFGLALVFAAQGFVRADEGGDDGKDVVKALQARVAALEAETKFLRSRDAALTRYVLANEARAAGLKQLAAKMREQGFLARSIPVDSRTTLLEGLDGLAGSLVEDLPQLTKEEQQLLKLAEKTRSAAGR